MKKGRAVPELLEGLYAADAHHQGGRVDPGDVHRRLADGVAHRGAISGGDCDAVSIARPLLANPDLPRLSRAGDDGPEPASVHVLQQVPDNVLEYPLGCYEEERYREHGDAAWERMMEDVMAYYRDEVPAEADRAPATLEPA